MDKNSHAEWVEHPLTQQVLKALRKHIAKHKDAHYTLYWNKPENAGERDMVNHALKIQSYELVLDELEAGEFCED